MADQLLFRGGSTSSVNSSTVADREIVIDTDTNTIVLGSAKDRVVMNDGNEDVTLGGTLAIGGTEVHLANTSSPYIYIQSESATPNTFGELRFGNGTGATSALSSLKSYRVSGGSAATALSFETTNSSGTKSETLRITNDRYARFASGSGGIQFNGDTAAANALDDYEEGMFNPDLSVGGTTLGLTGTDAIGSYTKIGNLCQIQIALICTSGDLGANTGALKVIGLPFASPNVPASNFAVGFAGIKNWATDFRTGQRSIYVTNANNSTELDLISGSRESAQVLNDTDLDFSAGSCDLFISMTYRAN